MCGAHAGLDHRVDIGRPIEKDVRGDAGDPLACDFEMHQRVGFR